MAISIFTTHMICVQGAFDLFNWWMVKIRIWAINYWNNLKKKKKTLNNEQTNMYRELCGMVVMMMVEFILYIQISIINDTNENLLYYRNYPFKHAPFIYSMIKKKNYVSKTATDDWNFLSPTDTTTTTPRRHTGYNSVKKHNIKFISIIFICSFFSFFYWILFRVLNDFWIFFY